MANSILAVGGCRSLRLALRQDRRFSMLSAHRGVPDDAQRVRVVATARGGGRSSTGSSARDGLTA